MPTANWRTVLDQLHKLAAVADARDLHDADLLDRFRSRHEEAAFTLLVQRHGPTVLGLCRRVLGDDQAAEDAFQATFLVLVRRAGEIRKQEALASFLYAVAYRIARKARSQAARRRTYELAFQQEAIEADPLNALTARELRAALDEEIAQLPAKYRLPLVLCYFAGQTHEQIARELGWPKSSVTARLKHARELLHHRLMRRGFTLSLGLLAAVLTEQAASSAVPRLLILSTVRAAMQKARGGVVRAASAAAAADSLARGAAAAKWTAALAILVAVGIGGAVGHRLSAVSQQPQKEEPGPRASAAVIGETPSTEVRQRRVGRAEDNVLGLPAPRDSTRPGAVMLHGGGRITNDAFDRFVELAGGQQARIVLVPSAGYRPADYADRRQFVDLLNRRFGGVRRGQSGRLLRRRIRHV
jgi:RNA polymerase sigma factor (sigma-70 family)